MTMDLCLWIGRLPPVGARLPPWVLVAMAQAIPLDIERLFGESGSHLESSP
jgi:hypothetical protein